MLSILGSLGTQEFFEIIDVVLETFNFVETHLEGKAFNFNDNMGLVYFLDDLDYHQNYMEFSVHPFCVVFIEVAHILPDLGVQQVKPDNDFSYMFLNGAMEHLLHPVDNLGFVLHAALDVLSAQSAGCVEYPRMLHEFLHPRTSVFVLL